MTSGTLNIILWLPLIPILLLMFYRHRRKSVRPLGEEVRVVMRALPAAAWAERESWAVSGVALAVWMVVFHFWPLLQPFDARNATPGEIVSVFLGWGLFFVWFGGLIAAGVKTLIRIADSVAGLSQQSGQGEEGHDH